MPPFVREVKYTTSVVTLLSMTLLKSCCCCSSDVSDISSNDGRFDIAVLQDDALSKYTDCDLRTFLSGNGTVEFEEFVDMMTRRAAQLAAIAASTSPSSISSSAEVDGAARNRLQEAEMRQAFRVFDIDDDGLIDADELRQTMANLGEALSEEDVRAMIKEADRNGDGKVDFDGTSSIG